MRDTSYVRPTYGTQPIFETAQRSTDEIVDPESDAATQLQPTPLAGLQNNSAALTVPITTIDPRWLPPPASSVGPPNLRSQGHFFW